MLEFRTFTAGRDGILDVLRAEIGHIHNGLFVNGGVDDPKIKPYLRVLASVPESSFWIITDLEVYDAKYTLTIGDLEFIKERLRDDRIWDDMLSRFSRLTIPLIRKAFPSIMAHELVSVQPLSIGALPKYSKL